MCVCLRHAVIWKLNKHASCGQDGSSCLMVASDGGHLEVVKHLCEHGGKELLMHAAEVRCLSHLACLLLFERMQVSCVLIHIHCDGCLHEPASRCQAGLSRHPFINSSPAFVAVT